MEEILVPLGFFAIIPLTVLAVSHYRSKAHERAMHVVTQIVERGEAVSSETIKALGVRTQTPHRDLKVGMILIAISIATVIFGGLVPDDEVAPVMAGIASFPFLVGSVYVIFWFFLGRKQAAA